MKALRALTVAAVFAGFAGSAILTAVALADLVVRGVVSRPLAASAGAVLFASLILSGLSRPGGWIDAWKD